MGEKNCDAALPLISLSSWWSSTYPDSKNILLTWEVKAWSAQIKRMSGSEFTITVHFIVTDRGDEPRLVFCSWHVAKLYCWGEKQRSCFHLVKLQYFSHVSVAKNLKTKIPPPCWTLELEMSWELITCRSHDEETGTSCDIGVIVHCNHMQITWRASDIGVIVYCVDHFWKLSVGSKLWRFCFACSFCFRFLLVYPGVRT